MLYQPITDLPQELGKLGVSVSYLTLWRRVVAGAIPAYRHGGRWVYDPADLPRIAMAIRQEPKGKPKTKPKTKPKIKPLPLPKAARIDDCAKCGSRMKEVDVRNASANSLEFRRRRRCCQVCGHRMTTAEIYVCLNLSG